MNFDVEKRQYLVAGVQILAGIASFLAVYLILNGYKVASAVLLFTASAAMFAVFFYNLFLSFRNKKKDAEKTSEGRNPGGIIRIFLYLAVFIGSIDFGAMY